jgi:phospholipase D1/2
VAKEKTISNVIDFLHLFRPNLYKITLEHGLYKWEVWRSYHEIKEVHKSLSKLVKKEMGKSCSDFTNEEIKFMDCPKFPMDSDHIINIKKINKRCKEIKDYLEKLLIYPPFRDHPKVIDFLQVSPLSFVNEMGPSIIENSIQKRTGDNVYFGHLIKFQFCCENIKMLYTKRWFVLKDTYIVYLNQKKNNLVRFVMLVDSNFSCKMKHRAGTRALVIKNLQRTLFLKFKNDQTQLEWYQKIMFMIENTARPFKDPNMLTYDSFAPSRSNQMCKWYVNAAQYMEHVMNALNSAREEIYITDWWMCPELYLRRPTNDLQYRLDKILIKKANEGVKIYILLFKEVTLAIDLLSARTKRLLTQCCGTSNIHVIRHSRNSSALHEALFWSHHEKSVIIDQSVGFMGGIDLCFGRWDDDHHRLVDLGRKVNNTHISNHLSNANEYVSKLASLLF